ncbi:MAG TPA: AlkA N-terminal domain-containing protein, partial [Ramlibacter sp.]|nr:AlkA N-terminal domain-containing protein [Ramlibacter sp.]
MPAHPDTLQDDACYLAMQAHDARFDGRFFTGVTSTGVYCRPVCRVRLPRRENCRFFPNAAQAEGAGFRPCLRCRPELAPQRMAWSSQDATALLATYATRLIDEADAWADGAPDMAALAGRLGVSDRHLRRVFEQHLGVSPLQYLQTRRLLTAKQLLADTSLPIAQVALMSGFASLRRFNAAFALRYGMAPTQLRRARTLEPAAQATERACAAVVRLGWRPPYDIDAMAAFFAMRRIEGVEQVDAATATLRRTLAVNVGAQGHAGWLEARFDATRFHLVLGVSESLLPALPTVIRRARAAFDLDADPQAINTLLAASFPGADGLRVPGAFCGFELAVRAV